MPRLRHYKNFNFEDDEDDPSRTEQDNDGAYQEIGSSDEEESGKSWLSNAAIISSFSTDKLKQTLSRYKLLIRILETELSARSVINLDHPAEYRKKTSRSYLASTDNDRRGRTKKSREGISEVHPFREMRKILRSLSLSQDAKRLLFEQWIKIQREAINHGDRK